MNLDQYGFPVTMSLDSNTGIVTPDGNDTLNRAGMILCACQLNHDNKLETFNIFNLEYSDGVFVRHVSANPNNVSADQLIPLAAYWCLISSGFISFPMMIAMLKRFGFAQNTHDFDPSVTAWKIPDFMLFRAMPLFVRPNPWMAWSRYVWDFYLIVMVLGDWIYQKTNSDPCDINCTLVTILACRVTYPTFWVRLACWLWPKLRKNIYADLCRYHRAESGGNPEIALAFHNPIEEAFG